jgi:flagellar hook-length control protein FliK
LNNANLNNAGNNNANDVVNNINVANNAIGNAVKNASVSNIVNVANADKTNAPKADTPKKEAAAKNIPVKNIQNSSENLEQENVLVQNIASTQYKAEKTTNNFDLLDNNNEQSNNSVESSNDKANSGYNDDYNNNQTANYEQPIAAEKNQANAAETNNAQYSATKNEIEATITQTTTTNLDKNITEKTTEHQVNQTFTNVRDYEIPRVIAEFRANIATSGMGIAKLVLNPESIGTLFVEINLNGDRPKIRFKAETNEGIAAVEKNIEALKELFAKSGINNADYSFERFEQNNSKDTKDDFWSRGDQRENHQKQEEQKARKEFVDSVKNNFTKNIQDEQIDDGTENITEQFERNRKVEQYV